MDLETYYAALRETDRLTRSPSGRLEFDRTRELIERSLPPGDPLDVLDVGGGTGIHAEWLVALGHRVEVVDPVAAQVAVAARLPGVRARVGDARCSAVRTPRTTSCSCSARSTTSPTRPTGWEPWPRPDA